MSHYYNDHEPFACEWSRNLIAAGLAPEGTVDGRDIRGVTPADLAGHTQVHLFSGILGWPLALQIAGVSPDEPLWTASCPCPPFSTAGKKKHCPECQGGDLIACPARTGYFICCSCSHAWHADERHLWPEVWRLVRECLPPVIFGEQVASADGLLWLAGVRASLEVLGYAVGSADLPAAGVGAPHIRQRFFWGAVRVADARSEGLDEQPGRTGVKGRARVGRDESGDGRGTGRLADGRVVGLPDAPATGRPECGPAPQPQGESPTTTPERGGGRVVRAGGLGHTEGDGRRQRATERGGLREGVPEEGRRGGPADVRGDVGLGDSDQSGPQGQLLSGRGRADERPAGAAGSPSAAPAANPWTDSLVIHCLDGKARRVPVERELQPLAPRLPREVVGDVAQVEGIPGGAEALRKLLRKASGNRTGRLKGAGNSIVPQAAALFIRAFMDSL